MVYRVSGYGVYTPHGPPGLGEANIIKNNIVAYARLAMEGIGNPYQEGVPAAIPQMFNLSNNIFYFDRSTASNPNFRVQGGCTFPGGASYPQFQNFSSNLYWRTDGAFITDSKAFHVQNVAATTPGDPCSANVSIWTFYTFLQSQAQLGEDANSTIKNPGFANPAYPNDDFSLPNGSPGVGFVPFDPNQAGRTAPEIQPLAIAPTFPTQTYNPATDY